MISKIIYIKEPELLFYNDNKAEDPRDGLLLYGPYEKWTNKYYENRYSISAGVIGPNDLIEKYKLFVERMKKPIISTKVNKAYKHVSNELQRPSFPGFEAVFQISWPSIPAFECIIDDGELESIFERNINRKIISNKIVDIYLNRILKIEREEDVDINIWFVLVPKKIYNNCRALKGLGKDFDKEMKSYRKSREVGQNLLFTEKQMFGEEINKFFDTSSDFHHLLKAKMNQASVRAPVQIIVEQKLEFRDIDRNAEYSDDMKASLAWNLSSSLYYKLGKKPWKINNIRPGVCYLGLVFKKFQTKKNDQLACSAAQLFLDDGDGTIFRGNNGLWMSENSYEFHLDEKESFKLMDMALNDYYTNNENTYPNEMFIHGRASFGDDEWKGFTSAIEKHKANTKLIGVVIQDKAAMKLFRYNKNEKSNYGVMRGIAVIINKQEAYLFTRGFIPRLNTSSSLETPNPLHVKVTNGGTDIEIVLQDIMALTKLNYNTCIYGDGKPVTLRFSDSIGSILTATKDFQAKRRQFRYYI